MQLSNHGRGPYQTRMDRRRHTFLSCRVLYARLIKEGAGFLFAESLLRVAPSGTLAERSATCLPLAERELMTRCSRAGDAAGRPRAARGIQPDLRGLDGEMPSRVGLCGGRTRSMSNGSPGGSPAGPLLRSANNKKPADLIDQRAP
jgi:hypothetical protein